MFNKLAYKNFCSNQLQKFAFTLAEVLIVLGIIGILAEMLIPSLINNINDAQLSAELKEEVSMLSQVTVQMAQDNGGDIPYDESNEQFLADMASKLKVIRKCTPGHVIGNCWNPYPSREGDDTGSGDAPTASDILSSYVLANGSFITFLQTGSGDFGAPGLSGLLPYDYSPPTPNKKGYGGFLIFDVNGMKPPNKRGRDIHAGVIFQNGGVSVLYRIPDTGSGDTVWFPCDENNKKVGNYGCSPQLFLR